MPIICQQFHVHRVELCKVFLIKKNKCIPVLMHSYSNTFLKWSIRCRIRIHDFAKYLYSIIFVGICI